MADSLARAQLARVAKTLAHARRSSLPALALMTDDDRLADPREAVLALPRGSLVVLRAREKERRSALAAKLIRLARQRDLKWIVADDPELAVRAGAHGAHFAESKMALAASWRLRRPGWLITCAAHSFDACLRAKRAAVDAVLLSPVFPTGSHPGRPALGSLRARSIARESALPVYALGGVNERTARQLAGGDFAGLAAISGLAVRFRDRDRCACGTSNV